MTDAYPLAWPPGKARTPSAKRQKGSFSGTRAEIMWRLTRQVEMLGGRYIIVSSDLPLRRDGQPRQDRANPDDPGVCVYFDMAGEPYAMACDRYDTLWQNVAAIANHIDATRRIERYGVATAAETLKAFIALPQPKRPHDILGIAPASTEAEIKRAWRSRIADAHPDQGGTQAAASEINAARDAMLKQIGTSR